MQPSSFSAAITSWNCPVAMIAPKAEAALVVSRLLRGRAPTRPRRYCMSASACKEASTMPSSRDLLRRWSTQSGARAGACKQYRANGKVDAIRATSAAPKSAMLWPGGSPCFRETRPRPRAELGPSSAAERFWRLACLENPSARQMRCFRVALKKRPLRELMELDPSLHKATLEMKDH